MIRLECKSGGHNKFYELTLVRNNGRVTVRALYGAIGQAGNEHIVYDGDSEQEAIAEMQQKQLSKQKKGYVIVGNGSSVQAPDQKKTVISK